MNKANLLRVADAMEKHEIEWLGYNQTEWLAPSANVLKDNSGHNCGTVACLCGWTAIIINDGKGVSIKEAADTQSAAVFLGLSGPQKVELFRATPFGETEPTADHAIQTLRYAAECGIVDWCAANPEVEWRDGE